MRLWPRPFMSFFFCAVPRRLPCLPFIETDALRAVPPPAPASQSPKFNLASLRSSGRKREELKKKRGEESSSLHMAGEHAKKNARAATHETHICRHRSQTYSWLLVNRDVASSISPTLPSQVKKKNGAFVRIRDFPLLVLITQS